MEEERESDSDSDSGSPSTRTHPSETTQLQAYRDVGVHERMEKWQNVCLTRQVMRQHLEQQSTEAAGGQDGTEASEQSKKQAAQLNEALVELPAPIYAAIDAEVRLTIALLTLLAQNHLLHRCAQLTRSLSLRPPITL